MTATQIIETGFNSLFEQEKTRQDELRRLEIKSYSCNMAALQVRNQSIGEVELF